MLPKDVDWSILAQCDYYAVEKFVQTPDRPAMRTVQPMIESIFRKKLERDPKWQETYKVVCDAYQTLGPSFVIRHDSLGGYRLLYAGKEVIRQSVVLKKNPIGFVREVPEGVVTNLSVMSSERTGKQLLLLGPMRFVNSDCSPNCEYDFSSDSGIVQLRVKKRIYPGDEVFVKYGADFFEFNSCLCRTCIVKGREETWQNSEFESLLQDILEEIAKDLLEEKMNQKLVADKSVCRPKKRRIKGRELVEGFNELADSPPHETTGIELSDGPANEITSQDFQLTESPTNRHSAPKSVFAGKILLEKPHIGFCHGSTNLETDHKSESMESEESSSEDDLLNTSWTIQENSYFEATTEESEAEHNNNFTIRASSPLLGNAAISFSLSEINDDDSSEIMDDSDNLIMSGKLFDGTDITVGEATGLTELFCSRFKLSDECSTSLHTLIKNLLPDSNNFPSGSSHVKHLKKQFQEGIRVLDKTDEDSLCVIQFRFHIREIFKQNINRILEYAAERKMNPHSDFNLSICPAFEISPDRVGVVNLVLFSDGVNLRKSTFKKELWPVWIQVADLPPKLRMSKQNIVLASLFVGAKHPDWQKVVSHIQGELCSGIDFEINKLTFKIFFKVRLLISDLGAKNHMLNMLKFNGFYGCHACTAKGKTIGRTHAYYLYGETATLRENSVNDVYVNLAETLSVKRSANVVGVKGKSAFSKLIEGLPLAAPVDYMHCVLLGVLPELLKLCYKTLSAEDKTIVKQDVANFSCPRELVSYSRKIRPLEELSQFKANENFNWLFYVSPLVFLNRLPFALYSHLMNFVCGVRLLLESSSIANLSKAEKFLGQFCKEIVAVHGGNQRIETINVRCLVHLTEQVRRFGPLFCHSAMSFESANRSLGEVFSGSHSECEVICRRMTQRHKLSHLCYDKKLKNIFDKL